ncbi:dihydroneopterin aldolase family protein [Halocatena halophila]|uniref:dihydroneopterin aldolase family protein n=1 Tax=Halocatena halophila TaxID=2814576 RepID=UPI002ED18383
MDPTDRETACFEAGIKFGTLYHQFAGTPVSESSASSLETAIERSIENQPGCTDATVTIHTDRLETTHGYTELTGKYLDVRLRIETDGAVVHAEMAMEEGYPMMNVVDVTDIE